MIAVSDLGKYYGHQTLFMGVSFQLLDGNRYGLVGANGSGKSTFLRILTGQEEASEGQVSIPKRARVGFLKQDHFQYEDTPILDVVLMGNAELYAAWHERDQILVKSAEHFDGDRYAELEDIIAKHDGYSAEARAAEILEGLGIPTGAHRQPLSTLSGGFKLRVLLAQTLAADPDVLLLDEPTNHLDILSIRWLEKFLVGFKGLVVVISHDHRFLDNVCTHILDVDYETILPYVGNYAAFMEAKVENRERKEAEIAKKEKFIADQKAFIERFRAKATKARQASSKAKLLERVEVDDLARSSRRWPTFRFTQKRPSGKQVLEIKKVSKAYGKKQVLKDVSLTVMRGDRLAVIGPNGIGKSTLLKIVMNQLAADEGAVEWGYETHPGYFAQDHKDLYAGSKHTVESWLWEFCPGEPVGFVRAKLGMVLFSGDEVHKKVAAVSGGEGARLLFARLHIEQPNVLILDEPTNHLDLEAIESLVEGLKKFDGTLIFVSHDRWFVSELANRIFEIEPEGINDFPGTYEEYLEKMGDDHLDADSVVLKAKKEKRQPRDGAADVSPSGSPAGAGAGGKAAAPNPAKTEAERKKLQKKRDDLMAQVEKAEKQAEELTFKFMTPGFYDKTPAAKIKQLKEEQASLQEKIASLTKEWEAAESALSRL